MTELNLREQVDLHHLNTFHVAAQARYFVEITEAAQLPVLCRWLAAHPMPYMLIGQASNILFRQDYPGLIIELNIKGIRQLDSTGNTVRVAAMGGEIWHDFVLHTLAEGWCGLENLSLIPGTVGAAPVQNIGAYGVELAERVESLSAVIISTGEVQHFSRADCQFGYRTSIFKQALRDQVIISEVVFSLSRQPDLRLGYPALHQAIAAFGSDQRTPKLVSELVCNIRRSKLPDPALIGNAGSFFWNPQVSKAQFAALRNTWPDVPGYPDGDTVKIPAAWLIESAGWKGYREGDDGVHRDHALVLVNHGAATGAELVALSQRIQASVLSKFGIQLWPEVRIV